MAAITLTDVNKVYGPGSSHEVHAVRDLSLEIADGEFMALLGPSGCGKTSTLRMIVGLEEATSGDIRYDETRVNELEPQDRNVAMAFETYALYPNFTIAENLGFPLEVRGVPAAERATMVRRMAEVLRIDDILDQRPGALSGGQQQRVSLGRALIRDPAVFILDEVMSHIDTHLKFQMLFDLRRLHQELGRTMVYVTHDQMEALALADRVAVMSNAVLQQVGTRNDLYHRPVNVFVADFIGEPPTNFFTAEVATDDNRTVLRAEESDLIFELAPDRGDRVRAAGQSAVTVGVRPQNIRLGDGVADDFAIQADVAVNEYLGEQAILTLRNGGQEFRALAPPDTTARGGDRVALSCARHDVMVFDAETEALIA